tara:strand:+ start:872 stop:1015 length:144 start_codon:yes stop_codon:yes gene_type:complete
MAEEKKGWLKGLLEKMDNDLEDRSKKSGCGCSDSSCCPPPKKKKEEK